MERVIKFRAWCERDKSMYFADGNYEFGIDDTGVVSFYPRYGTDELRYYSTDSQDDRDGYKIEVMQFTGLLDKNGKEIYEGDIIESPTGSRGVVVFEKYSWGIKQSIDRVGGFNPFSNMSLGFWEIIGNLFDNPELLK